MRHYFLNDDHTYNPCEMMVWAEQFEQLSRADARHVANDRIDGKHISTVWLGLDHSFSGMPPPLVFETMIFDGDDSRDIYMDRYTTWDQAVEGHKKAIQWVMDGCKDQDAD